MNKNEFLSVIKDGLKEFPAQELEDIIYDYEEHFFSAMEAGKKEEDVVNELGDPYVIVNGYRNGYLQKEDMENETENSTNEANEQNTNSGVDANKILKVVIVGLLAIILGPIVLGLGLGVCGAVVGILVAIVALPFSLSIAGVTVMISSLFNHTLGFITVPSVIADFPMGVIAIGTIGSMALSLLMLIITYYIIKAAIRSIKNLVTKFNERGRA